MCLHTSEFSSILHLRTGVNRGSSAVRRDTAYSRFRVHSCGSTASSFGREQTLAALFTKWEAEMLFVKALSFFFLAYLGSERSYSYNWSASCTDNRLSHWQENGLCLWSIFTQWRPLTWYWHLLNAADWSPPNDNNTFSSAQSLPVVMLGCRFSLH